MPSATPWTALAVSFKDKLEPDRLLGRFPVRPIQRASLLPVGVVICCPPIRYRSLVDKAGKGGSSTPLPEVAKTDSLS